MLLIEVLDVFRNQWKEVCLTDFIFFLKVFCKAQTFSWDVTPENSIKRQKSKYQLKISYDRKIVKSRKHHIHYFTVNFKRSIASHHFLLWNWYEFFLFYSFLIWSTLSRPIELHFMRSMPYELHRMITHSGDAILLEQYSSSHPPIHQRHAFNICFRLDRKSITVVRQLFFQHLPTSNP